MSDFLIFSLVSAFAYSISLLAIKYAKGKTKKVKHRLICLIVLAFSLWNGWAMSVNQNTLPLEVVEKEWNRYVVYCRQEHISWSDLTFPEWLSTEADE